MTEKELETILEKRRLAGADFRRLEAVLTQLQKDQDRLGISTKRGRQILRIEHKLLETIE